MEGRCGSGDGAEGKVTAWLGWMFGARGLLSQTDLKVYVVWVEEPD